MEMSQEKKQEIAQALEERGAILPCPRCSKRNFIILDGYFNQPINPEIGAIVLGGQTIPTAVVACSHCGYLSQHALGILGLMPAEQEKKDNG